ncbi:hypothetical protein L1887_45907 [Cichorium endivia]|nr:hypothetical protein L1887_45907 [Cichorium endivia]
MRRKECSMLDVGSSSRIFEYGDEDLSIVGSGIKNPFGSLFSSLLNLLELQSRHCEIGDSWLLLIAFNGLSLRGLMVLLEKGLQTGEWMRVFMIRGTIAINGLSFSSSLMEPSILKAYRFIMKLMKKESGLMVNTLQFVPLNSFARFFYSCYRKWVGSRQIHCNWDSKGVGINDEK